MNMHFSCKKEVSNAKAKVKHEIRGALRNRLRYLGKYREDGYELADLNDGKFVLGCLRDILKVLIRHGCF